MIVVILIFQLMLFLIALTLANEIDEIRKNSVSANQKLFDIISNHVCNREIHSREE